MDFKKLTEYIDSLEEQYGIHAVDCKITRNHEMVYRHMIGHSDYEGKRAVTDRDLYRFFSNTKVVTMIAVMQLAEQKKLTLTDPLHHYLPEFAKMQIVEGCNMETYPVIWSKENAVIRPARNTIRIIDLMTMTAGFSYDMEAPELLRVKRQSNNRATTREVVSAMAQMPLIYEPGTRWSYSMAHDVLAAVIEVVSGLSYSAYLQKYIFDPLEIKDMHFHLSEKDKERVSALYEADFVTGKIHPDSGVTSNTFAVTNNYESGGAGLIGTVDAYSVVVDALCNGGVGVNGNRILTEESIRLMGTNYITGQMVRDFAGATGKVGYGYGLGVRVLTDATTSRSPLGEFGWDGAAGSYAMIDPMNHISIFYAQHVMSFNTAYFVIHPKVRDLTYEALGM